MESLSLRFRPITESHDFNPHYCYLYQPTINSTSMKLTLCLASALAWSALSVADDFDCCICCYDDDKQLCLVGTRVRSSPLMNEY
jgi:hypothetical protein